MTPQERQLVDGLFDRLAALESAPRDPDAEAAIREGQRRAPNAVYALVQTVLVQDEALKRADARIRELGGDEPDAPAQPRGFLDTMRDALTGGAPARRGSVPPVRAGAAPMGVPPQYAGPGAVPASPIPQEAYSRGSSFLGTAAAAAAGMIGGSLLLGGIRSMFSGNQNGPFAGNVDQANQVGGDLNAPWGNDQPGGDLARQAGIDDVGRGAGLADSQNNQGAGLFDTASNDSDFGSDSGGGDIGSDSA